MYDITSSKSFENVSKWRHGFIDNATPSDLGSYPMVLMGNKLDKESDRQVDKEEAEKWCSENHGIPHFETSAHASTNVEDAFMAMVKRALEREKTNKGPVAAPLGGRGPENRLRLGDRKKKPEAKKACDC